MPKREVMPADIELLVIRSRGGDTVAFTKLVNRFERSIYTLALQKLGHPEDAQDVAQDAFLEAFRTLDRLRAPAAFPGWIRKITLNLAYRRLRRRDERPETLSTEVVENVADRPFPDVDPRQLPSLVLRAISRVEEAYQLPLMLRYLEKMTPQQIARELEMNPNTVRVVLHRGSNLLRMHFQDVMKEAE